MFQALAKLINESGLRGVQLNLRPVGNDDKLIRIILSFQQKDAFEYKLIDEHDDKAVNANADNIMALRRALNVPLIVTCAPDDAITKVGHALTQLREGVVEAATTYSELDIGALLKKAAKTASAAKASTAKADSKDKAKPAEADTKAKIQAQPVKDGSPEKSDDAAPAPASEPEQAKPSSLSDFDSL